MALDSMIQAGVYPKEQAALFGSLVIQDAGGRMKPANTFASELLRKVSKKDTYKGLTADQVLLSITNNPALWYTVPIIYLKRGNDSIRKIAGLVTKAKYAALIDFFDREGNYKLITQLESAYIQNIKNASQYINAIEKDKLAVFRGYSVNKQQKIVREIINSIMCNYFVDFNLISSKYKMSISEIFEFINFNTDSLDDFISDKILVFKENKISINKSGRLFTRNIAMRFDPLIDKKVGTYSNTV